MKIFSTLSIAALLCIFAVSGCEKKDRDTDIDRDRAPVVNDNDAVRMQPKAGGSATVKDPDKKNMGSGNVDNHDIDNPSVEEVPATGALKDKN